MAGWIGGILVGVALVCGAVLLVVEVRIMRKPESERSDREREFLKADRALAKGNRAYSRNVAPFLGVAAGILLLVLSIPLWVQGRVGAAALVTAVGAAAIVGLLLLRRFFVRHRGPSWEAGEVEATREADVAGRPRWFTNTTAGLWLGAFFLAFGVIATTLDLSGRSHSVSWSSAAILLSGVLVVILALVQRRSDQRH
ncbi:hypothetical protein AS850_08240 [Frondihabitans sp. 762G35]|uniref:hypothetical protein n=1 Tax=Frondihabitans sp. 762G35 TaxID=1446794 RepID=UPI000D229573|nr:hypothetical protein [Frondihabitans sp. 762G35]ARC57062.1 hypothetical protein AS850_08240 [Frondihabitans sp. 762G35]